MFDKFKLFLLFFIIFIVSGCDAEYHISIDKNLVIEEKITLMEENDNIYLYAPTINDFIDDVIAQVKDEYLNDNYEINKEIGENESGSHAVRLYNTFESLTKDNILIGQLYNTMNITVNDNIVNLKFDSIDDDYQLFKDSPTTSAIFNKLTLTIELPFEVLSSNADYVDEAKRMYVWYYSADVSNKDVELLFNSDKIAKISVVDRLEQIFKDGNYSSFLIIGIIVILGLILISYIVVINKYNNSV